MTTISWDGQTLAADSKVTFTEPGGQFIAFNGMYKSGYTVKIFSGEKFLWEGQPVQVATGSGDLMALTVLSVLARDLPAPEEFNAGSLHEIDTRAMGPYNVLLVLQDRLVLFTRSPAYGMDQLRYFVYPRSQPLALGSGPERLLQLDPVGTAVILQNMSASMFVALAARRCGCTGGNLTVWDGTTIRTEVPLPAREEVVTELMKLHKQQQLLLTYQP